MGGVIFGVFDYALALALSYILASPLKLAGEQGFIWDIWGQAGCLVLTLMLGWTLAKWKKF